MNQQEPLNMPLEEAMRTQRAIRRLKSDPVDDSLVLHLLELAMKAPTGSNAQNWEFIVVKDRKVVAKLGRLNRTALNVFGPIYKRALEKRMDEKMLRIEKAVRWQADHFEDIPVVVVACLKGVIPPRPTIAVSSAYGSIYPAVQNLLLAARGRAGRGVDHHAVVEFDRGQARPGLTVERDSSRGRSAGLAHGQVRADYPPSGGGIRFARPVR